MALAQVNSSDATIDAYFDYIDQYDIMHLCSSEPANFAGIAAVSVADTALTRDTDFTKANGDVSGRKETVAAKVCRPGRRVRHWKHLVIARVPGGTMRYVTTCTSQAVTPSR